MSLELVQRIYDTASQLPNEEEFYHTALQDITEDGIESQVYYFLKEQDRLQDTPAFFQEKLRKDFEKGLFQNLYIKNQLELVLTWLEQKGIDVIPLKGITLAEKYFGHVGARGTSDIDLLILWSDLTKTISVVEALGFTVEEEQIPGHFHCSYSKPLPHSKVPLVVEIHWNLVKENTSCFQIEDIWNEAKSVEQFTHIKEMSPNHLFYMICLHGWRHNLGSMKYFIDIIQLLLFFKEELNYEEMMKLAASHQTKKRMVRTLSILYHHFPFLKEVKPLPFKERRTLWQYRPTRSVKLYSDFVDYQFLSYDTFKHSLTEFVEWISTIFHLRSVPATKKGKS